MSGKKRVDNFSLEQRMGFLEAIKVHQGTIQDRRSDTSTNRKKQLAWEDISKWMAAHYPERPKSSARDLRELWRRMKTKAKALAREKKLDMQKRGGGEAAICEVGEEIVAILTIIAGDLDQVHNDVDDDAPAAAASLKQAQHIRPIPTWTSTAHSHLSVVKEEDGVLLEELEEEKGDDDGNSTQNAHTNQRRKFKRAVKEEDGVLLEELEEEEEEEEEEDDDDADLTQNAHTNKTGKSKGKGKSNKSSTSPAQHANPVLLKTTEALSFLKEEHEAKMKLIALQQEAAKCKRRAYEAKIEYYTEKGKRLCLDL
uniref:fibrinogen silencer-binding protein-like n=1 Tax=Myxine glutinosa TaxID=7769 RepID=UPI00358DF29C